MKKTDKELCQLLAWKNHDAANAALIPSEGNSNSHNFNKLCNNNIAKAGSRMDIRKKEYNWPFWGRKGSVGDVELNAEDLLWVHNDHRQTAK